MRFVLALLAAAWFLGAVIVFGASKSAVHEILAGVLMMASMICLAGAAICDSVVELKKALAKDLAKAAVETNQTLDRIDGRLKKPGYGT